MFYGIDPATNHHPWFSTLVMGSLHWIGGHVSDNFGVFVVILAQSFFCAFVFSRICKNDYILEIIICRKTLSCNTKSGKYHRQNINTDLRPSYRDPRGS